MDKVEARIVKALESGPTYKPFLELVVGRAAFTPALRRLKARGVVEVATDLGPHTYRLTGSDDRR